MTWRWRSSRCASCSGRLTLTWMDVPPSASASYAEAMANSGHPATETFGKELRSICTGEPRFRNLDVRSVQTY